MFDCYDINVCVYFFFQAENRIKKFEKLKDFYGDRFETNVIKGQISTFHEVCNFVGFRNNRMNMQIITSRVWCYIKVRNKWIEMKNVIIVICTWCLKKNDRNIRKCSNLMNHDELFNIWHTKPSYFNGGFFQMHYHWKTMTYQSVCLHLTKLPIWNTFKKQCIKISFCNCKKCS